MEADQPSVVAFTSCLWSNEQGVGIERANCAQRMQFWMRAGKHGILGCSDGPGNRSRDGHGTAGPRPRSLASSKDPHQPLKAPRLRQQGRQRGTFLDAKGGPSYGSSAWLGRAECSESLIPSGHIGSDRRSLMAVGGAEDILLSVCCLALPPHLPDGPHEVEWLAELGGLNMELETRRGALAIT